MRQAQTLNEAQLRRVIQYCVSDEHAPLIFAFRPVVR